MQSVPRCWLACLLTLAAGIVSASAQTYPTRVIAMVVPFGPGSGTEIVARVLADKASDFLGQKIIIEDVGGAGGTIGVSRAAKAAPDGLPRCYRERGVRRASSFGSGYKPQFHQSVRVGQNACSRERRAALKKPDRALTGLRVKEDLP